ncbi:MAG: hypothetical protein O2967_08030 [Proteobacteria bacterium]|nr:hypothetical protein [Pseudomonadota bacterium]
MLGKIRILPIVILAAMMLLGIKVVELRRGVTDFGIATARAQSNKSKDDTAKTTETKNKETKANASKTKESTAKETDPKEANATETKTNEAKANAKAAQSPAPRDETDTKADEKTVQTGGKDTTEKVASRPKGETKTKFTPAEIEVLQRLSGRREALEQRSRQMAMREKILQATEKRIDNKIGELKKLEGRIKGLLLEHDKETEAQIKSLVKVYENMKPKEAARIFEELEMDILLDVTERMKEVKMAKVLAAMDPKKAKSLTVRLATHRRLPKTGD